jgi:hypothetical protein
MGKTLLIRRYMQRIDVVSAGYELDLIAHAA